jgi:DNA invertase Pin-like site-specific DNA recombinase
MSDSTLSPYYLQNNLLWSENVNLQIERQISNDGMSKKLSHPNVAIYLRCSHEDQSVDAQQRSLQTYLLAQGLDLHQCNVYVDEGVSAKTYPSFTDRTQGSRLITDIESGKIDTIWGFKVDRFFRCVASGATWIKHMNKKYPNVKIFTQDCQAPTNTAAGRSLWHLLLMIAENENESRSERTGGGMQHKQELLQKTSHAVFGWEEYDSGERNITQGKDVGKLILMKPNKHEFAVRQWLIESYGTLTASEIAKKLNRWKIPTATGREWTHSSVRSQVKRPAKLHEQIHRFDHEDWKLISPPFRTFKPAHRF